jgi:hypothetical protein
LRFDEKAINGKIEPHLQSSWTSLITYVINGNNMLHIYVPHLHEILLEDGGIVTIPSNIVLDEGFSTPILNQIALWAVESGMISQNDEIGCFY